MRRCSSRFRGAYVGRAIGDPDSFADVLDRDVHWRGVVSGIFSNVTPIDRRRGSGIKRAIEARRQRSTRHRAVSAVLDVHDLVLARIDDRMQLAGSWAGSSALRSPGRGHLRDFEFCCRAGVLRTKGVPLATKDLTGLLPAADLEATSRGSLTMCGRP
jgi:hypothetical protein